MSGVGNEAQVRIVADQVGDAAAEKAIRRFAAEYPIQAPAPPKPEIPAPLKWAAGIVSGIMGAAAFAMCVWVVSTLSDLQQTVTRIDERQQLTGSTTGQRLDKIEERLMRLEQVGREQGK